MSNKCFFIISNKPVSISLGYIMDSFQTSAAYLSKMAESALAARAKMHPPCTLKHRLQQENNSLLVNALNRKAFCPRIISNGCLQNWSFRAFEPLKWYPVLKQELQNHDPR